MFEAVSTGVAMAVTQSVCPFRMPRNLSFSFDMAAEWFGSRPEIDVTGFLLGCSVALVRVQAGMLVRKRPSPPALSTKPWKTSADAPNDTSPQTRNDVNTIMFTSTTLSFCRVLVTVRPEEAAGILFALVNITPCTRVYSCCQPTSFNSHPLSALSEP